MRLAALAWRWLWARPLVAVLNLTLLALGLGAISFVLLVSEQIEHNMQRELAGIDLVVGAEGSPLQLILSGVFHIDAPTGNIPLAAVDQLREHPLVETVVPLALGDNLQGFRIVGSTHDYVGLYGARLAGGRLWQAPLDAVLGADVAALTGKTLGARFVGVHGLGRGGHVHGDFPYTVTGVLARCGCVLDRLVLTSLESVWQVHEVGMAVDDYDRAVLEAEREVTLLLVGYRSPLAAATLPRWVNAQPELQAASPALESARLMELVGVGTEVLRGFGVLIVLVAGLSVFVALTHAVREREPDLAMLRMLGAPPRRVAALLGAEAAWLALLGLVLGLALGHGLTHLLGWYLMQQRSLVVTGAWFSVSTLWLVLAAFALAALAAARPAWRAARLDVTRLLQPLR
jgi:putative ABC transport system permease protein